MNNADIPIYSGLFIGLGLLVVWLFKQSVLLLKTRIIKYTAMPNPETIRFQHLKVFLWHQHSIAPFFGQRLSWRRRFLAKLQLCKEWNGNIKKTIYLFPYRVTHYLIVYPILDTAHDIVFFNELTFSILNELACEHLY